MSQYFRIHPENPQARLITQAVQIIRQGGVVIYPTDTAYALGCHIGDKSALERVKRIRRLSDKHNFTLLCRDLSELATYAKVSNQYYRLLKASTPGPYTFLLMGTTEVPKRLMHPKRKTIGLRVPDHKICQALLEELGEPMMTTTLILPDDDEPMIDPEDMRSVMEHEVDLIIDGGFGNMTETAVISLMEEAPEVVRDSGMDVSMFV